ncbi:MAG: hypothetical protein N3A38_07110 [Planctomycetota bacterium]|nr:hypothetical protein [Planctomycetota bacterium]
MEEEISLADSFKESVFAFEAEDLPEPLKIVRDAVGRRFRKYPEAATTLVQIAGTMDEAARLIDQFKARTCGSAYSLAVINLTNFPSQAEFEFLSGREVLGDPRTVFLCSLRGLNGDIYRLARAKVEREARLVSEGKMIGTPSCMDNYSPANREEKAELVAEAAAAYIRECDFRARTRPGVPVFDDEAFQALKVLKKSDTSFYGLRPGGATRFMRTVPPKR